MRASSLHESGGEPPHSKAPAAPVIRRVSCHTASADLPLQVRGWCLGDGEEPQTYQAGLRYAARHFQGGLA